MSLLILITFYIFNLSFIIKTQTQNCKLIRDILVNSCDKGKHYNSMKCTCEDCPSGLINENICYSNNVPLKSIYGLSNQLECIYENGTKVNCNDFTCPNNFYVTELDNEGKWLGYLMCTNGNNYVSDDNERIRGDDEQYQLFTLSNEFRPNREFNRQPIPITPNYEPNLVNYYNYSCLNGTYEKSCQYLANLCTLSLYYYTNRFCYSINELSKKLKDDKKIINDHLLKYEPEKTESILEQIIEIETSFDSKDNEIHINLIDLYIAK